MSAIMELEILKHMELEDEKRPSSHVIELGVPCSVKVIEIANADYALALSTGPQLSPISLRSLQLYLILLISCMASLSSGFNDSVITAITAMPWYLEYFHIDAANATGAAGTVTALISGMFTIGSVVGVVFAGPMADQFGRRGGMSFGSIMTIAGAFLFTVAQNTQYLFAGRFFLGFGVTITTTAASCYVVEMSPPQWRGRLTGLYNTFYLLGALMCVVLFAPGNLTSSTWRVPLAVQIIPPGVLAALVHFIPESPRWLLSVGRNAEARQILAKYHGNDDENASLVLLEWKEFREAVKLDASDKRWWDYSELLNASGRGRTIMVKLMAIFGIRSAANSFGYHLVILFRNVGAKTAEAMFRLHVASAIIVVGGALIGTSLIDKVGRRALWLWGTLAFAGTVAVATGFIAKWGVDGGSAQGSTVAITAIFLAGFVFCLTYTPLQVLYPAECLRYNTRAKGMALYNLIAISAAIPGTYGGPIAIVKAGWKFYIVLIVIEFIECGAIWYFAVETKGRTMEELAEIFEDPHPAKVSVQRHKVAIMENAGRTVIVNVRSSGEDA